MKLYLQEKVFSWSDAFVIRDQDGQEKYTAKGEVFRLGKELHVWDRSGEEVLTIRQKLLTFLPKYYLTVRGRDCGELTRKLTFFKPRFEAEEVGVTVTGDFTGHDYQITRNDRTIATVKLEWFTWGDSYEVDIPDPADELLVLAVMLAVDCANEAGGAANAVLDIVDTGSDLLP